MYNAEVENRKKGQRGGGRPPKIDSERSTIKLNCWVTPIENSKIQTKYVQMKAGKKLAFAQFLKQVLLSDNQSRGLKPDELLLTIIINLQEGRHQLQLIYNRIEEKQTEEYRTSINNKIDEELLRIQKTIEQIITWLYES